MLKHMRRASRYESCAPVCTHLCVSSQCTRQLHMVYADALPGWVVCMYVREHKVHREHTTLMVHGVSSFTYAAW